MPTMSPRFAGIALLVFSCACACASACASTTLQTTWRGPSARTVQLADKKVVGLFISADPALRRSAENAMARELSARGAQGVPAYTVLDETEIRDRDGSRRKLESLKFSGAVVMRIVGSETQVRSEPGTWSTGAHYRHFWGGYWDFGWASASDPSHVTVDRTVSVETLVYSFGHDELIWAGISRTVNPTGIDDFIAELASAVTKNMASDGLLPAADDDWGSHIGSDIGLGR